MRERERANIYIVKQIYWYVYNVRKQKKNKQDEKYFLVIHG